MNSTNLDTEKGVYKNLEVWLEEFGWLGYTTIWKIITTWLVLNPNLVAHLLITKHSPATMCWSKPGGIAPFIAPYEGIFGTTFIAPFQAQDILI